MTAISCIVPIPAEPTVDLDAGTDAYPVIKDVSPAMPGPLSIDTKNPQTVTFFLSDSDIPDTLYVRVFRDYDKGNVLTVYTSLVTNDPVNGKEDRQALVGSTSGWCNGASQSGNHQFDAVVSDRMWDDTATAQPNRTPEKGGKTSTRSWLGQCTTTP